MIFYNEMSNYNGNPIILILQNQILHDINLNNHRCLFAIWVNMIQCLKLLNTNEVNNNNA